MKRNPGGEVERRPAQVSRASVTLARYGGWVLVSGAVVLIALAAIFADQAAVAPIFALGGVALLIVGVLLPRIQGQFEFSPTGFKLFLAELEVEARGLDEESKADLLDAIVESAASGDELPDTALAARGLAARAASTASQAFALEQAAADWLRTDGWQVQTYTSVAENMDPRLEADVVAERDGEYFIVEAKATVRTGSQVVAQLQRLREAAQRRWRKVRVAVVLGEQPPRIALDKLRAEGIEIYVQRSEGFTRLD